jgi:DNA-binding MarR family transcriptional regulator
VDHVDRVLEQWARRRPDLDVSAMGVVGRVSRLAQATGAAMRRTFREHGLDAASFDVLATLRRGDPESPLTPTALMEASMVTSGAITQRLDRLEGRGWVQRRPSPRSGRVVEVVLTPAGREVIDRALPDHVDALERLMSGLTADQRSQLGDLLRAWLEALGDGGTRQPFGEEALAADRSTHRAVSTPATTER